MKRFAAVLAIICVLGVTTTAGAIDFKIRGQMWIAIGGGELDLINKTRQGNNGKTSVATGDKFRAIQRTRLWLDAVASESLSGHVWFQMGGQNWGRAAQGAALGADGVVVKLRTAYIDWTPPDVDLKVRMGLQQVRMPHKAGGPGVLDTRGAGITASWAATENLGFTGFWIRPNNDNYEGDEGRQVGYLDNFDLFGLTVPIKYEGVELTPWAMMGMMGRNTFRSGSNWTDGAPLFTLRPYFGTPNNEHPINRTTKTYGSTVWAGLPLQLTLWDPWNIEFDFNYGYVAPLGRYDTFKGRDREHVRGSVERQGWLAKALVEYKMDWGVPGVFGWYASGDDGNIKNGSERMPSLVPYVNFTSFFADGNLGWAWQDFTDSYSGTWGVGAQVRDISFVEKLTHTVRAAWWGGTNSTSMVKYMDAAYSWNYGASHFDGPYMTTRDGMLEFNLVNVYKMYENFNINFEAGYVANFMDNDVWKKAGARDTSFEKRDIWKVQCSFLYAF